MNFKRNIVDLIKDAHLWEYADISDTRDEIGKKKPKLFFTKIQWLALFISITVTYIVPKGFSADFAGYIITGLSLFVGLLFSFVLTLYDKFSKIDFSEYKKEVSEEKNKLGIRLKNFFKKISVLTLYSAILSILCIILLSITLLEPKFNLEINYCELFGRLIFSRWQEYLKVFILIIYRCTLTYFLIDFVLITTFIIASFYDYIISEMNKIKLS